MLKLSIRRSLVRRVCRGRVLTVLNPRREGEIRMRFMVIIKANKHTEAGVPDEKILTEMGKFNEELVKAGIMLAGEGLHPSSKGARVGFSGGETGGIRGPVAETNEPIAGCLT